MQFNVARLLKGSVGIIQQYDLDVRLPALADTQSDHLRGQVRLMRVDRGIWVSGALATAAACACSRCLQSYSLPVQFRLDEVYHPVVDVNTGSSVALPGDADPAFTIDDHHTLDISDAVRQAIVLSLPMKPLCDPYCAGICPDCGVNLNEASCSCQKKPVDPRWTTLLKTIPSPTT